MTHPEGHDHGPQATADHGPAAAPQLPFSAAEWEALQKDDLHAGKAVVGLMASIFTIGLLLYAGVLIAVTT
ncbi:MAG TPA: hypothetical protein VFA26_04940 [Gemmataceae bacterium]|nr:hypothetical protein [Gemmataceae bacterium]